MESVRPVGHPNTGMCMWPAVMMHNYLIPSFAQVEHPGGPRWWKDYALEALVRYLTHGKTLDTIERKGSPTATVSQRQDFCMYTKKKARESSESVIILRSKRWVLWSCLRTSRSFSMVLCCFTLWDNAAALSSLVNGSSSAMQGDILIGATWSQVQRLQVFQWF